LDLHLKAMGQIYGSQPIYDYFVSLDLGPSFKMAFRSEKYFAKVAYGAPLRIFLLA